MNFLPQNPTPITLEQAKFMNPLVLAFVGDSVQQLLVRTNLACTSSHKAGQLHALASQEVKATTQAIRLDGLLPHLTEDETDIYRRARNSKTTTIAKSASYSEYKKASGLEAVIGYLYLIGSHDRLSQLLQIANIDKGE